MQVSIWQAQLTQHNTSEQVKCVGFRDHFCKQTALPFEVSVKNTLRV